MLMRNAENLDTILVSLDAQQHSMGLMAVYIVKFAILNQSAAQNQGIQTTECEKLICQITDFILMCNGEQIRCAPESCKVFKLIK